MTSPERDFDPEAPLDADVEAQLRAALATGPMPDAVWTRLERALHAEAATSSATVIPLAPRRRRTPVLGGLVAAGVVVIAGAVIVPQVLRGPAPTPVAAQAPIDGVAANAADAAAPASALAPAPEAMSMQAPADAMPADAMPAEAAPSLAASPRSKLVPTPRARQVVATGTDYRPETIRQDVIQLVDTIDASHARLMSSVTQDPDLTEGAGGFTATPDGLAGCLEALTAGTGSTALVVDRAAFNGQDVGIVVVPTGTAAVDPMTPFDQVDIWVVRPDCTAVQASVLWHDTVAVPIP